MPLFLFLGGVALQRCGNGTIWNAASAAEATTFTRKQLFRKLFGKVGQKT
jgi:hypothetical protein